MTHGRLACLVARGPPAQGGAADVARGPGERRVARGSRLGFVLHAVALCLQVVGQAGVGKQVEQHGEAGRQQDAGAGVITQVTKQHGIMHTQTGCLPSVPAGCRGASGQDSQAVK